MSPKKSIVLGAVWLFFLGLAFTAHGLPVEPAGLVSDWQGLPSFDAEKTSVDGPFESSPIEPANALGSGEAEGQDGSGGTTKQGGDVLINYDGLAGFGEHDLAIGPQHVVQVLRAQLQIRRRDGSSPSTFLLRDLFAAAWTSSFTGDLSEIHYSPEHDRFVLALAISSPSFPNSSYAVIAVSKSADPYDGWWLYRVDGQGHFTSLSVAADTWGFYLTADELDIISDTYASALWSFDTALLQGAAPAGWRFSLLEWPDGTSVRGLRAATPHTVSSEISTFFLNTRGGSGSDLLLWRLSGDRTFNPTLTRRSMPVRPYHPIGVDIRQPDTTVRIDGGDTSARHVVYGYRRVYAVWTSDPDGDGSSSEIVSVKINTDSGLVQTTDLVGGDDGSYYWQPSLVVNGGDGPLLNTAIFSMHSRQETYPEPGVLVLTTGGSRLPGFLRLGSSVAPSSGGIARWPSFAGASYDWFDPGRAWASYSYIGAGPQWRTGIASVALDGRPLPGGGGGGGGGQCFEGPSTACLVGDRFELKVDWRTPQGDVGVGIQKAIAGSDNSILFWFFDESNVELLAKVLDGCGFNGHFWVFSAATTNVEYTLTVRDRFSGRSVQYFNRQGDPAPAVTDTGAFPCP